MDPTPITPMLVASTGGTYCCSIAESKLREKALRRSLSKEGQDLNPVTGNDNDLEVNYFKSTQW
jgi:hypothetical protein